METIIIKNEVVNNILNRRSIRSYKPEQINPGELETIIQCGINAPSANNLQSWEARIVQDPNFLNEISRSIIDFAIKNNKPGKEWIEVPGFHFFYHAPTVIFIACKTDNQYSPIDCGLFGQNILLAAESLGIGSCVIGGITAFGYFESADAIIRILSKLNFSKDYYLLYAITLGYENGKPEAKPRDRDKILTVR